VIRRAAATIAAVLLLAVGLTGCEEEERPSPMEMGIECAEAGGSWNYSDWSGYHCEFP